MKFKNIKSFSHNLSHSYVSFENYVDGQFVFKELKELAVEANGQKISICWLSPLADKVASLFSARVIKSIEYYREWIPHLLAQHQLDSSVIVELRTDIYLVVNKQLEVQAYARHINGKDYVKNIYEFADFKPYKVES